MGMFLCLSGVIGKTKEEVVASLDRYVKSVGGGLRPANITYDNDNFCVIDSYSDNTTVVYPYDYMQWDETSAFISKDLQAPVFSCHIHDSDLWMYVLYVNGTVADEFNPVPEYWDENISDKERESWKGDAAIVAKFVPGLNPADIEKYLIYWPEDEEGCKAYPEDKYAREDWQLVDFMKKLKLPFPLEDHSKPEGETYLLWTDKLKLAPEKSIAAAAIKNVAALKSNKPWWRFW